MQPLAGVTIVSLEHAIAAPFATRQLADLGARVIKIERPETGDFAREYDTRVHGMSSNFVWCNRSKESVALDLKSALGQEALRRLIAGADVLIQNLAPGALERMGLSYESLKADHPRLIVCDVSGYGRDGPHRDRKAYDLLIQSESGFLSVTGTEDAPSKSGCSIADIAAGMYAYSNILAALIERGRTGKGRLIDISMLEAMAEWMSFPLYYAFEGGSPPQRKGAAHATIFPYGPFPAADGAVMLGVQNDREWRQFCTEVLEQPGLAKDVRFASNASRTTNREALIEIIKQVFVKLTRAQIVERLDNSGIANANVNDIAGLWAHPQLAARDRWRLVDTPVGPIPALLPPGQTDARMDAVPGLGDHTAAVLAEIGLSVKDHRNA
jgi:itaconate CoA-transferase